MDLKTPFLGITGGLISPITFNNHKHLLNFLRTNTITSIAMQLLDEKDIKSAELLLNMLTVEAHLRLIFFTNSSYVAKQSICLQNKIDFLLDQSDSYINCLWPIEDIAVFMSIYCDFLLTSSLNTNKKIIQHLKKNGLNKKIIWF